MRAGDRKHLIDVLLIAAILLGAAPGWGEEATGAVSPMADEVDVALSHFLRGKAYFQARQYDSALQEFREANRLHPEPILLFNIGQAYRRSGKYIEAIAAYKLYLEKDASEHKLETGEYILDMESVLKERSLPAWKKKWFWAVLAGSATVVGVGLGIGLGFGLRDQRRDLMFTF